jgi:3-dehydroquinate dehydratase II
MSNIASVLLVIHGPNLNRLGQREPSLYGASTLQDIEDLCKKTALNHGVTCQFFQSNHEGALIDAVQAASDDIALKAVLINAGAYTHTSIALHDALRLLTIPIAEVHITDPKKREVFRHISYIEPLAKISICGKGPAGYVEAIDKILT